MINTPQWILVRYVADPPRKHKKLPVDWRTGKVADAHDKTIWLPYEQAKLHAAGYGAGYGIGLVITWPYFFIDVDGGYVEGKWSDTALKLFAQFPGAYTEISHSGTGAHIVGRYEGEAPPHRSRRDDLHIELYTEKRFVAITEQGARGNADTDYTQALHAVITEYFTPQPGATPDTPEEWTTAPCAEWRGPVDDVELIRRARRSRSARHTFGGKASFADLWDGNDAALAGSYPPDPGGHDVYNASSADAALAQHLAFWTGKDCARIERLMQQSALKRDKWEQRDDYLPRTIRRAVALCREVCKDKNPTPPPPVTADPPTTAPPGEESGGPEQSVYVDAPGQRKLFAGCVYVQSQHRIMTPSGVMLTLEQFRASQPWAGRIYTLDAENVKTTDDASKAFLQSRVNKWPTVSSTCFRPDLAPGAILTIEGRQQVNTYVPIPIVRKAGDPSPFLNHLKRLLPDAKDRAILQAYLCALVQHRGVKFHWAPLIQGAPGNGKTLITDCMVRAIGQDHVHMPPAHEISEKFNSWLFGKILIAVEDVFIVQGRTELFEVLKPMITSANLARRAMNQDQVMQNVTANFLFNTNHLSGLQKSRDDRRICALMTAQQSVEDIYAHGMNGAYFHRLYRWLEREDGYAIVAEWLHTEPIPDELNPATLAQRAPETTSTVTMIRNSFGAAGQELQEAIEQARPGFAGGWISSVMLTHLMRECHIHYTRHQRNELVRGFGYVWHPGLDEGRCTNVVLPDNARPRLFVTPDHPAMQLRGGAVAAAYTAAQQPAPVEQAKVRVA